ncbi:MAG: MBL fold metallo-hydrolase [Candidatus Kapabacteria bacterium]|nr:MBL fold metallo-hydrolase [Candidatus Kapabacteria bacterium]
MRFTLLGTGTSSGVPTISCNCPTCTSDDVKDKRLRTSLLVESKTTTVIIDTSPDFRQQMLKYKVSKLDGVIFTHHHFDHIGGFDDIRAFNYTSRKSVPIYLTEITLAKLKRTFFYAFEEIEQLGGGIPLIDINIIDSDKFQIGDIVFEPIKLLHGKLEVLGFRINDFAYCTDTNFIPQESVKKLKNLDVLVLDALRYTKHTTHFNLEESIEAAKNIGAKKTYLTHIAHQIKHEECEPNLPKDIFLAYDGLVIEL